MSINNVSGNDVFYEVYVKDRTTGNIKESDIKFSREEAFNLMEEKSGESVIVEIKQNVESNNIAQIKKTKHDSNQHIRRYSARSQAHQAQNIQRR